MPAARGAARLPAAPPAPAAAVPAAAAEVLPVAVVVVAWNSGAALASCLEAAAAQRPAELVVVDNASTDGTEALVRRQRPPVRLIGVAHNSGFAAGCNLGIACSRSPFVLLLNDDAVLGPGYIAHLLAALRRRPAAASATGKLLLPGAGPPRLDSAGLAMRWWALCPLDRGHGAVDRGQFDRGIQEVFGASGAAVLLRRAALDGLRAAGEAPFDERLFAYYEDVDLAWRLRRRGHVHLFEPRAVAWHGRRGPAGKPRPIATRAFVNRYTVWRKNEAWWRFAAYAPLALPWELVRLARLGRRAPRQLAAILAAAWPAWRRGAPQRPAAAVRRG